MKKQFTKEEKAKYFQELRSKYKALKNLPENDQIVLAFTQSGLKVSLAGFAFVYEQMLKLKLEGLPVIDMKTFKGWLDNGFKVRKGETCKVKGITWVAVNKEKGEEGKEENYAIPKVYNLFHRSQVEENKIGGQKYENKN